MNQMINKASKIFELLGNHIHYCNNQDCCIKELADKLFDETGDEK